jgi:hypothetical protein
MGSHALRLERLQHEAELHAAEDKQRREEIEITNQADSLAYSIERQLSSIMLPRSPGVGPLTVPEPNRSRMNTFQSLKPPLSGTGLGRPTANQFAFCFVTRGLAQKTTPRVLASEMNG